MAVSLICPTCSTAVTFHREPISACPFCQTAFPDSLRLTAEAGLLRQAVGRPTLLTVGLYLAPTFGAICVMASCAAITNLPFVSFTLNGQVVTGHEFFRSAGPGMVVLGILSFVIAYGIWQECTWTRWAIISFWLAITAMNIGFGWSESGLSGAAGAVAGLAAFLLFIGWYLFSKENVVTYYRALARTPVRQLRRNSYPQGGTDATTTPTRSVWRPYTSASG